MSKSITEQIADLQSENERLYISQSIRDGIKASKLKSGRKLGEMSKLTSELKSDIKEYLHNRDIKQVDLMQKYKLSRNTLKKYIEHIAMLERRITDIDRNGY